MIALARVDLPEPFGPISAWMLPLSTSRLTPLRICLPSAVTCRLRISSSANSYSWSVGSCLRRGDRGGLWGGLGCVMVVGELDQLGEGGAGEGPGHPALNPRPEKLRGACLISVDLMRTRDLALGIRLKTLHR